MKTFKNVGYATRIVILILPFMLSAPAYSNEKVGRIWDDNQDFAYWSSESNAALILSKNTVGSTTPSGLVVSLDTSIFQAALRSKIGLAKKQNIIYFPNALGEMIAFDVKEKSNFSPILAAKFPEISSFIGVAVNDASQQIRFSLAPAGIQAAITSSTRPEKVTIEKIRGTNTYAVADLTEAVKSQDSLICTTPTNSVTINPASNRLTNSGFSRIYENQTKFSNASTLTKYRLAVSTNGQYTSYHGGTVAGALAGINATLTHVNAIFERDFGVTLELIGDNDLIIYTDFATDPYSDPGPGQSPFDVPLISELQSNLDAVIGSANYDHGHMFSTISCGNGGCGNAGVIGGFCNDSVKGGAWSDSLQPEGSNFTKLVAHEIGHQVGANHTFSNRSEGTGKNVEPGSGTTVMSYAGITGSNNVALQGDDYFHHVSIEQTLAYLQNQSCHIDTPNENNLPVVEDIPDRTVPILTPFILSGSATDEDSDDVLSYTWEQIDNGVVNATNFGPKNRSGANFRSLPPSSTSERYMPKLSSVLSGNLTLEDPNTLSTWETLSSVPRDLNFGFTVRDNAVGGGGVAQKTMKVSVVDTDGAFRVTSPASEQVYLANTNHTVSWNVAGTNLDPILADKVTITLSADGGLTYPYTLASDVENDGSHEVVMPNFVTNDARVRVQPNNDNIFYAINNQSFTLTRKDIILTTDQYDYTVCSAQSTEASLTYGTSSEYSDTAVLSASNLPTALSVGFSPTSVSTNGTVINATIAAGADIAAGTYLINIDAISDSRSQSLPFSVKAYAAEFTPIKLLTPSNNSVIDQLRSTLTWRADINAEQYRIEVSAEESFSEVLYSGVTKETSFDILGLQPNTSYFWRVSPLNRCSDGVFGDVLSFTTLGSFTSAKDLPVIIPADSRASAYTSTISITENGRISDVNVLIDVSFSNIHFILISLTSPSNTTVDLIWEPYFYPRDCNTHDRQFGNDDISAIFDDQGEKFNCGPEGSVPIISGRVTPQNRYSGEPYDLLSRFNNESSQGDWVLTVRDRGSYYNDDRINSFALEITTDAGVEFENYPPVAYDGAVSVTAGQTRAVSLDASDPEGSPLTYQLATGSSGALEAFSARKTGSWLAPYDTWFGESKQLLLFESEDYAISIGRTLALLDIKDPSNPTLVSELETRGWWMNSGAMSKDESKLFITSCYGCQNGEDGRLSIYDISDLTNIKELSDSLVAKRSYYSVVLSSDSNTAFITSGGGLEIVDVSDASNPRSLSTFYGNSIIDVTLSKDENTAYVTGYYGLYAIDISDRSEPKVLTYAATRNLSSLILSSDKQIAYIKSTGFGLIIYDVSNPTDLKPLGTLEGGWNSESRGFGKLTLSPEGTTIYLSEGSYGIKVIDVRDPENPVLVSTIPTTGMSNGLILSAAGDKLYSANRAFHNFYRTEVIGGVEVFEIGNKPLAEGDIMGSVVYYNSPADESVSDSFDFRVNDGALDSQLARVSISSSASGNDTWLFTKNLDGTVLIDGCVGVCASDIVIPESIDGSIVMGISDYAFASSHLTSVTLPDTIITIGDYAFYKNELKTMLFGDNITNIGLGSFEDNNIIVVSFLGDRPSFDADTFKLNRNLSSITYCSDRSNWPGDDISNGLVAIQPTPNCDEVSTHIAAITKVKTALESGDVSSLTLADLRAIVGLANITPSYIDQYLIGIRLTSLIENKSDIQSIVSSINSVMSTCPSSAYFVSVAGANLWPSEISWALMGDEPDISLLSGGASSMLFTCLADGRYTLNMYDSFGDGWVNYDGEADTFFSIMSGDGIELAKESLTSGFTGVANIKLGEYPNQVPIAATQNVDVIRGIPTGMTLSAEDADLDPLTMRLTKAPVSGSLYKTISIEPESTYASKAKSYDIVLSNDQKTGYLADGTSGLTIIDLEINPLTVLSSLDTEGLARSVKLSKDGRTAFLADGTLGLKVIDVSDSLNPIIISSIAVGESVYDIALSADGNYALVAHLSGISRIDVSRLNNPTLVATVSTPGDAQSIALSANNERAYVGDGFKGFHIIDISQPSTLTVLSSIVTDGEVYSIALSSDSSMLYVTDGSFGLKIFNVENSNSPAIVASVTGIGFVRSVEISNDGFTAYLATSQSLGVRIVNITDPSTPILLPSSSDKEIDYVIPTANETKAYAVISTGLRSFTMGYKNPFSVGDTVLETPIYLSNDTDTDAAADAFEFVANDGRTDSAKGIINLIILDDADRDRVADKYDEFPNNPTESVDTDGDGIGNNADLDDDGDSVNDLADGYPLISLNGLLDSDGDGIPNICDASCILAGMTEDKDDDDDGVADENDLFPLDSTETMDSDLDGTGNNADPDDDNDGVLDASDDYPLNSIYTKDSDGDGMPDSWEIKYGLDPNDPSDANSDQDNDGVTALDEFLAGTIPSGSLDIDGNGQYDALTDGLLLLRGMFGLDGSALVTGTIASDAAYTESVDIESRIATLGVLADIDGNGQIDALTDGLLTLRYLFGLEGDTLIAGVVASDATRVTAVDIEAHLKTLMPTL